MHRTGLAVFAFAFCASASLQSQDTGRQSGTISAFDVSVSPQGDVWLVGRVPGATNRTVLMNDRAFPVPSGIPARIAADATGAWVVNADGTLWHWTGSGTGAPAWAQSPLKAMDVSVGANGQVWAIGADRRVMRLNNGAWEAIGGSGIRVAVDPAGNPWVVSPDGQVQNYSGTTWTTIPASATDISVAPDGSVFAVGTKRISGGFEIFRLRGSAWEQIPAIAGLAIAAGGNAVLVAQEAGLQRMLSSAIVSVPSATVQTVTVPSATVPSAPVPSVNAPSSTPISTSTQVFVAPQGTPLTVTVPGTLQTSPPPPAPPPAPQLEVRGAPAAPPPETPIPGKLICPIIGNGARLEVGCIFVGEPAKLVRSAPPTACASPSFADPRNGGECWTCPTNFIRNVSPVDSKDACWKPIGESLAKATQTGRTGCAPGFFSDPRNGGECWACPAGFGRTLDPVTVGTACSKGIFGPFSTATFGGKIGQCTGGSFGDPIDGGTCWTCPAGYRRTLNSVKSDGACAQMIETQYAFAKQASGCSLYRALPGFGTPFRDPRNGGECWACPLGLVRSAAAVTTPVRGNGAACVSGGNTDKVIYQMAQYPESGPYRFMPGLLKMALADRRAVDAFMTKRANGDPAVKRRLWASMVADPAASAELKALLFASLITAAKQPQADIVAQMVVRDFETYMRRRRTYVATEAVTMYEKWKDLDAYNQYQAARRSSGIGGISADVLGAAPPDFRAFAWSGAVPDSAATEFVVASAALSRLAGGTTSVGSVVNDVGSFNLSYLDPVFKAVEKGLDLLEDKGSSMVRSATTLSRLADGAMVIKATEGAMIATTLVSGAIEISKGVMTLIEKDKAEAAYGSYISEMSRPVTVKAMLESGNPDNQQSLLLYWALATSPYKASDKVGTGRMSTAELCGSNAWTTAECATAKEIVTAAARAAGY